MGRGEGVGERRREEENRKKLNEPARQKIRKAKILAADEAYKALPTCLKFNTAGKEP